MDTLRRSRRRQGVRACGRPARRAAALDRTLARRACDARRHPRHDVNGCPMGTPPSPRRAHPRPPAIPRTSAGGSRAGRDRGTRTERGRRSPGRAGSRGIAGPAAARDGRSARTREPPGRSAACGSRRRTARVPRHSRHIAAGTGCPSPGEASRDHIDRLRQRRQEIDDIPTDARSYGRRYRPGRPTGYGSLTSTGVVAPFTAMPRRRCDLQDGVGHDAAGTGVLVVRAGDDCHACRRL